MHPALPRHIATLDVLRVAAALAVLAYHYLYRGALAPGFTTIGFETGHVLGLGIEHLYLGVHLFFTVSGFVIMASVADRGALAFAIARFVRLWPVFVMCATITLAVLAFADEPAMPSGLAQWLANLTFVAPAFGEPFADGVYWSIVVELVFYAWVALMIAVGVLPRHVLAFTTAWLVAIVGNELILESGALRFGLVTRFGPWFIFGILMHRALTRGGGRWLGPLLLATLAMAMHNVADEQLEVAAKYAVAPNVPAVLTANALLLLAFLAALQWRYRLPATGWLAAAGALTYPLYLLHQNLGYVALNRLAPVIGETASVALVSVAAIALAWLVSERFDRPARRALGRLIEAVLSAIPSFGIRRTA